MKEKNNVKNSLVEEKPVKKEKETLHVFIEQQNELNKTIVELINNVIIQNINNNSIILKEIELTNNKIIELQKNIEDIYKQLLKIENNYDFN